MQRKTGQLHILAILVGAAFLLAACSSSAATPTATVARPAATAAVAASPSPAGFPLTTVAAPSGVGITITAPAANATVPPGDVRVSYEVKSASLVPVARATRVEDLHVHVLCDVDPAPYLGTSAIIPPGLPNIIHTADPSATCAGMQAGQHRVTIILTGANHISVNPPASGSRPH